MESKQNEIGLSGGMYKPLSENDVKRIATCAFELLEKSGIVVHAPSAFEAFARQGALCDENTRIVRLPRSLVEDAIASNPSSITLYSRDGNHDAILTGNRVHYGTGGTAIYVIDPRTGKRRPSLLQDVIDNAVLVDQLEHIHVFTINVFPNEIKKKDEIDLNRFFHALDNTTKHVMAGVYSMEGCKDVVKLCQHIAGGDHALKERPFVSFITLIISPFKIDKAYGEMACYFAQQGLPTIVPTEPICGTTSPVTLASNVLTHVAETLAGIAMIQSVHKGAPGICGSVGSICDLRNMNHLGGAIERAMINASVAQMAQYFELPLYSTGGTSDAKEMGVQAAYESALSSLLVAMSGANYIHDIAGLMEADLTVSYEKLVVDNEILGMCQRVLRGIEVSEDTLAMDLIMKRGPGSDFLAEEHTVKYMRSEFFDPELANRQTREEWESQESASSRAKVKVSKILANRPPSRIPSVVREQILNLFPEIRSQESAEPHVSNVSKALI